MYRNNPFHLRYSPFVSWLGASAPENGFCTFQTLDFGLRAGLLSFAYIIRKYNCVTPLEILRFFYYTGESVRNKVDFCCRYGIDADDFIRPFSTEFFYLCHRVIILEGDLFISVGYLNQLAKDFHLS